MESIEFPMISAVVVCTAGDTWRLLRPGKCGMTNVKAQGSEDGGILKRCEKEGDSETSFSSNEDFEVSQQSIIGGRAQILKYSTDSNGKLNALSRDFNKSAVVKRRLPISSYSLQQEQATDSTISTCPAQLSDSKKSTFDENEDYGGVTLEETVERQQQVIEKLKKQLKSCALRDASNLLVHIEEGRTAAFERKDGFNYFFVIVDWKKSNQGAAQQHLHLAFKQSNSSIYVYDHGPLSGKYFTVGDRIIDIDGIKFIRAVDLRDRILWSHQNKDHFTSIIERPTTDQAIKSVSTLLQPAMSSFSVLLSV
uniref:Uncharacterized protein n=1 Tax=Setaria digitata TaxID=48799 RepID=A0A915PKU4_9BILA